ncbi:hypothetical protein IscW_ISCW011723 [Ixodes scapularis]|uniref:Transposase Helix-turn-helix domain-containing protein n=1 Tax=Ixodes scapularis TaxID=6945 RepID=B7Q478_IXOSC|nr:hypothetical protein IscW_ISCW011723 [Ixodes scapularis]|eukprot:XP_002411495.1 hypothetical protein IscW_ISCW011723 [Ixodes scapularis]
MIMSDKIRTVSLYTLPQSADPDEPSDSERIWGMEGFVSDVVPRYTDTQFKEHFRMYRSTFEVLLQLTEHYLATTIGVRVPTAIKVLMTLWLLGHQESYRGAADRFGVHKSTLHFVVSEIGPAQLDGSRGTTNVVPAPKMLTVTLLTLSLAAYGKSAFTRL